METHVTSKLSRMKLSAESAGDGDDRGEVFGPNSIAGGGRHDRKAGSAKDQLRISQALRNFLIEENLLPRSDGDPDLGDLYSDALRTLLKRTSLTAPPSLLSRDHPLPDYFISSSHNTYLMAHQLYGHSSAKAYEIALRTGSRCVEIDVWDNGDNFDEPKVTHGYTLVSHVPFRKVCETIREVFDDETRTLATCDPDSTVAPIMLSLENHCGEYGQGRIVKIMEEVFGQRLLREMISKEEEATAKAASRYALLREVGAAITVIVEYHIPGVQHKSDSESAHESIETDEETREARRAYREFKKESAAASSTIIPELAELGVYAQSVKPLDNSWYDAEDLLNGPHHHLINISETGLSQHLPAHASAIARHNARHLMRVYPKGSRVGSSNLKPVTFWGLGAQICALNWQTFGTGNQLNDALFNGSEGYVLKPAALRAGGDGEISKGTRRKLRLFVAGATDVPISEEHKADSIKPYLTCNLYTPCGVEGETHKRKTGPYRHHALGILRSENPPATEPIWKETLEWTYEDNELVFLRMLIKSDDAWARNTTLAVVAIRLMYAGSGWSFVRMMDMKGQETQCTVLVHFEMMDA